jgi:hypothetical protein
MRHLFLIQAHKEPRQIARLVHTLRKGCPESIVLVSHDDRKHSLPGSLFEGDHNVHVIRGYGGRGDFAIVDS